MKRPPHTIREQSSTGVDIPDSALSGTFMWESVGVVLVGLTLWLWWGILLPPPNENALYQLDVGQGDAVLMVLSDATRTQRMTVLIDGGPDRRVLSALTSILKKPRIDLIILTHPDLDHMGGLADVIEQYHVGVFISTGARADSTAYHALEKTLGERGIPHITVRTGDRIRFGEHVFYVLSPDDEWLTHASPNEASVVLLLTTGAPTPSTRTLLTGDIGFPTEERLLTEHADISADILKVGHHGSRFSSSEQFVSAVSPKLALVSVGGNNRFGHPAPSVLETFELAGARILRTDQHGSIRVALEHEPNTVATNETHTLWGMLSALVSGSYRMPQLTRVSLPEGEQINSRLVPYTTCAFATNQTPRLAPVVLNEIAWMGGQSGATHEWIELRKLVDAPVQLAGWQLVNENERIRLTFPQQTLLVEEYALLSRSAAVSALGTSVLATFSGALRNEGEGIRLFDNNCVLVDEALGMPRWSAGDNASKRTMERVGNSWQTSAQPGGTPGSVNSIGATRAVMRPVEVPSGVSNVHGGCAPGQVDINSATAEALATLQHIGPARAADIIAARPFVTVGDLARVRGLGSTRVTDIVASGRACAD